MKSTEQLRSASSSSLRVLTAHRTTIATAVALTIAELAFASIHESMSGPTLLGSLYLAHASLAALIAVALWRRGADERWTIAGFLTLTLPLLPIFWLAQSEAIAAGALWQPFIGRKLLLIGLALLAPLAHAVAAALLTIFMAEWLLVWHHHDLGRDPLLAAAGEPWVTSVYFAAAAAIVVLRWRACVVEERLHRAEAQAEALRQLKEVAIGISDQANTPLQTLEVGLSVLHRRHPEERPVLDRMHRALRILFDLGQSLSKARVEQFEAVRNVGARLGGATPEPASGRSRSPCPK